MLPREGRKQLPTGTLYGTRLVVLSACEIFLIGDQVSFAMCRGVRTRSH
jgi:hypothetical protein